MIQENIFEPAGVIEKGINPLLSKIIYEGNVGGSKNSEFFAHIPKRRSQSSGFDRGRKRGEALVARDGGYQILRWSQHLINAVDNSIAGHDIEPRNISAGVDGHASTAGNTDTKVVSIGGLDNIISKVAPEDPAADDVVQENVRKSVRVFQKCLNRGVTEFGESLLERKADTKLEFNSIMSYIARYDKTNLIGWCQHSEWASTSKCGIEASCLEGCGKGIERGVIINKLGNSRT